MQQILRFTVLFFFMALFSCETLVHKEYRLHARNYKQEEELNLLLEEEGIYKEEMDSSLHKLSFMYSDRQNDLSRLNAFFKENDLINLDTASEEVDSSYLFIDEQNALLDSIEKVERIEEEKELARKMKEREQKRSDSVAAILRRDDSLKAVQDSVVSPVIDMINVF